MDSLITLRAPPNGSKLRPMVGAVIYIRVSTKEQTENLSLPTQLRACEEYCRRQGYEILERFHEEGESAKTTDRSQLQKLLTFCRLNKGRVHFVVVFNLTRFGRDKYDQFALRSHLQSLGISRRSATEPDRRRHVHWKTEGRRAGRLSSSTTARVRSARARMRAAPCTRAMDVRQLANSSQMTLRERAAGARFQITLECERARLVGEFDQNVNFPRGSVCGVRTLACIVGL
jgi:hypothetical protein